MKAKKRLMMLMGCCAGLMAVGCSTPGIRHAYEGPEKKPDQLAVILGTTNQAYKVFNPNKERISFLEVDDDSTIPWYSLSAYPTAVYVEPGKRKIDVQYEHIHGVARGPIWVDALSNRTYRVKVMNPQARTERVYFVIEDITAQTLVGGAESVTPAPATPAPAQP